MAQQVADYEHYKRIKLLGEGAFGKAFLAECVSDSSLVVIKQVDLSKMSDQEKKDTLKEAKILESFNHPNIVRFKEVYKTKKGKLCIVMDYADGGDLAGRIKGQKGQSFPENQILDWFTQICLALKHVHDRKIIHRDLKGQNIFLTKTNIVKLGDFGIARVLSNTRENVKTMVGTPYYLSPEIINGKPYSFKSDIWSLGVVLYELCALKPPFDAQSLTFLAMKIVKGQYNPLPYSFSKDIKTLVGTLLQIDPLRRPSVNDVLKMPIVQNRIQNFLSKSVKIQEFSHTVLHKQQFVKNNVKFEEIKSVNNEAPIPQHLLKAQQQQEEKNAENQKPPLPGKQNPQPPQLNKFAPAANPINNLLSPKDEKMKIPESNRTPSNNAAGKPNYHYRNSPDNKQPAPEPYKGPKIVDASKEKPEFKNVYQPAPWQAKNAEEKVGNWAKMENNVYKNDVRSPQVQDLPKDRYRNSPNKEPSRAREEAVAEIKNWNPPQVNNAANKQKNIVSPPEPLVKQQIQQKQVNRADPPKRNAVDREIMGGFGGGGGVIGFAPTPSNRNAKEAPKKKENLIVANKKPSNQPAPVKKNEVADKAQAQQKLNEVKKKMEDEKVKREKKAAEEAERKKAVEDLRNEKEKDRAAVRKQMIEDIKKKRAHKGKDDDFQVEVLGLRGNSVPEISPEETKEEESSAHNEEEVKVQLEKVGGTPKEVKRRVQREFSVPEKIEKFQDVEENTNEVKAPKNNKASKLPNNRFKRAFSKKEAGEQDKFMVEIFVPGKKEPIDINGVEQEQEINNEQNEAKQETPKDSKSNKVKALEADVAAVNALVYQLEKKNSQPPSDDAAILETGVNLSEDKDDDSQDPFITKLENDIKNFANQDGCDHKELEELKNITDLIEELNKTVKPEDGNGQEEVKVLSSKDIDQEDREDEISSDLSLTVTEKNETKSIFKQEADEHTMEVMMDYSRLEELKMRLENILGTDTFLQAYRVSKDLFQKYSLNEIEEKFGRDDGYANLFPFLTADELKNDLDFVFTYVICEERAEGNMV